MKVTTIDRNTELGEFKTIRELTQWLDDTPEGATWRGRRLSSHDSDTEFYGVPYDEARTLLVEGWTVESEKLSAMLKVADSKAKPNMSRSFGVGVVGFAPIVPLALAGVPQNMITQIKKIGRDKVITVNKSISYNCGVSTSTIEEESVKALAIVRRLERCGYAVNLNIVWGVSSQGHGNGTRYLWKVRVKNANERLNLSKMSFAMVNPAFLRRIMFNVLEKWEGVPYSFYDGYGRPIPDTMLESFCGKEVTLPAFISERLSSIRDVSELANALNIQ